MCDLDGLICLNYSVYFHDLHFHFIIHAFIIYSTYLLFPRFRYILREYYNFSLQVNRKY